jgi:hypothetical protein
VLWMGDAKEQDTPADEEVEVKDTQEPEMPKEPEQLEEPRMTRRPSFEVIVVSGDGVIS